MLPLQPARLRQHSQPEPPLDGSTAERSAREPIPHTAGFRGTSQIQTGTALKPNPPLCRLQLRLFGKPRTPPSLPHPDVQYEGFLPSTS